MRPTIWWWLADPAGAYRMWRWWRDVDRRKRTEVGRFDLRQIARWEARS